MKEFGTTGKRIFPVGMGALRFDIKNNTLQQNADIIKYAYDRGVNYFDTAPPYLNGISEDILALAFSQMNGTFYVGTKSYPEDTPTAEQTVAAIERALRRLGREKLDFFYVWCIRNQEQYELAMRPGGMMDGILRAKQRDLVDSTMVSLHIPSKQIKELITEKVFDGALLGINILNFPYRLDGARYLKSLGMGVMAMNPLYGGFIPQHEKQLSFLAYDGKTPVQNALKFAFSVPEVDVSLVGATYKSHIDEALAMQKEAQPLSAQKLSELSAFLSENMNNACTSCGYCDECPMDIPVPAFMQYYNQKQVFGWTTEQIIPHYRAKLVDGFLPARSGRPKDCIACGKCETLCTQHLNIVERLKEMQTWE